MIASLKKQPELQPLDSLPLAWWLQFEASNPNCIYFCGPFDNQKAAEAAVDQYLEDLKPEHQQILNVCSRFCQPRKAVIAESELTIADLACSSLPFFTRLIRH